MSRDGAEFILTAMTMTIAIPVTTISAISSVAIAIITPSTSTVVASPAVIEIIASTAIRNKRQIFIISFKRSNHNGLNMFSNHKIDSGISDPIRISLNNSHVIGAD